MAAPCAPSLAYTPHGITACHAQLGLDSKGATNASLGEKDHDLVPLSRDIHRNPVETTSSRVHSLATYAWSRYPASLNHTKTPTWVVRSCIYELLGHHQTCQGYRATVEAGVDDERKAFDDRGHTAAVMG